LSDERAGEPTVRGLLLECWQGFLADMPGALAVSAIPGLLLVLWALLFYVFVIVGAVATLVLAVVLEDELLYTVVPLSTGLGLLVVTTPALVAMYVGLARALWARLRDGAPLTFTGSVRNLGGNLAGTTAYLGGFLFLSLVLFTAGILPGIVFSAAFQLAFGLVVLSRVRVLRALRVSFALFRLRPMFCLGFAVSGVLITWLIQSIPVLGIPLSIYFYVDIHVRAHRAWFGDGDQPQPRFKSISSVL
jgi:hypothetical protein